MAVAPRVLQILRLTPGQKFGSLEEQIVLLARAFAAGGGAVMPLFIAGPEASVAEFKQHGVDAEVLDLRTFTLAGLRALAATVRRHRIDVVNWNFVEPIANPYLWGLSIAGPRVRHWYTDHNSRFLPVPAPPAGVRKAVKALLLGRYEKTVCVSGYVRDCLRSQDIWPGLVTLLHFINTDRFAPDAARRASVRAQENAGDKIVALTVGQLIPEKGMDIAVRALAVLPANGVLWIVGTGPEASALERLVESSGLQDRVKFFSLRKDVAPLMQAADLFICASVWGEAAGLVNIEAQASGLPVVASRIGGIPEYVIEGETGLLFQPGDVRQLAEAVAKLSQDPALRARMGAAARALAVDEFSPVVGIGRTLALYSQGLKE